MAKHEWMTDGISLDASEKILAEYESGVLVKTKASKRANELAELANTALMRRNELTEQQIEQLASIAQAAEFLCDMERNKLNQ